MYESDNQLGLTSEPSAKASHCKVPTHRFNVNFLITETFKGGKQIAISVDGIVCFNLDDAMIVFKSRADELKTQWEDYMKKNL